MKKIYLAALSLLLTFSSFAIPGPITGSLTVCAGLTTGLGNSVAGGTWTSLTSSVATINATSGIVTGIAAGTSVISYSDGTGVVTAIVTVNPLPAAIAGPSMICDGTTGTLTDATPGGTWSSANVTIAVIGSGTGQATGVGAGVTTITYAVAATGCITTRQLTVNPTAPAISGSLSVCLGSVGTLSNPAPGGMWSSSNTSVASVSSFTGIFTGVSPGTANITYTLATGCSNARTVTVNAAVPAITGGSVTCPGSTIPLADAGVGGFWSSSSPAVGVVDAATGVFTGISTGTVIVYYTLPTGCMATTIVTVSGTTAITGGTAICTGTTGTLSNAISGGTWSSSNTAAATINVSTGVITGIAAGTTTISYTNSCGTVTSVISVGTSTAPITGAGDICVGAGMPLGNATLGGAWTSSDPSMGMVSATGMFTAVAGGTVTITYTAGSCGASTVAIHVLPLPSAYTVTGGGVYYTGGPGVPVGITGSEVGVNYTLYVGSSVVGTISGTGAAINFGPQTVAGTYTVRGVNTASGCFAIMTGTATILLNPIPPITGSSAICFGGTSTLSESVTGGVWSSSNPAIASVSSVGVVSGVAAGTSIISYTYGSNSALRIVTVNSPCTGTPATGSITASATTVCIGSTVTLSAPSASVGCGLVCQWQSSADGSTAWSNVSGATSTTCVISPTTTRYYRIVVTCGVSGSAAFSGNVFVQVNISITGHSVIAPADSACVNSHFHITACGASSGLNVTTFYGDATSENQAPTTSGGGYADFYHAYSASGTYTIKQVLYLGAVAKDSAEFSYNYLSCSSMPLQLYYDGNTNCVFDSGDVMNMLPISVAIDSSGIAIDTMVVTSGLYYRAYGPTGTVYGFRLLPVSGGLTPECPFSGMLYDTVLAYGSVFPVKKFALTCTTPAAFDLAVNTANMCGRHTQRTNIIVSNSGCTAISPVVSMTYSSKYSYTPSTYSSYYTNPLPTSAVGNTLTWNLSPLAAGTSRLVTVYLERPAILGYLTPGDTINTKITVSPTAGDVNPANNVVITVDTVKLAYDPNDIAVVPEGYILPCTQLQYKVQFENTGNDTAHNIYVLDTLSDNLDYGTLAPVMASHAMNISILHDGGYTIARFDFPNINLLDTSHHQFADGMFLFNIKVRNGPSDGIMINNRVGIYFDDNAVVMTNQVRNTIGIAPITGPASVCMGATVTMINTTAGGTWASGSAIAGVGTTGIVTGVATGITAISYTVSNTCATRTATKILSVNTVPSVTAIVGPGTVCVGAAITLADITPTGLWSSATPLLASVDAAGHVTGLSAGVAIISYYATNVCGTAAVTYPVTVNPMVTPTIAIASADTVCAGVATTFSSTITNGGSAPAYVWKINGTAVSTAASYVYVPADGDVIDAKLTSTAACVTTYTVSSTKTMAVLNSAMPVAAVAATPAGAVCTGTSVSFAVTPSSGGSAPGYIWIKNSAIAGMGSTYAYVPANGDVVYCKMGSNFLCRLADTVVSAPATMIVAVPVAPGVTITASPGLVVTPGEADTLVAHVTGGGTMPQYQWSINGMQVAGATSATFIGLFIDNDSVTCKVIADDACAIANFESVTITVSEVGVHNIDGTKLTMYPNPNNGSFVIKGQLAGVQNGEVIAEIHDMIGQVVYKQVIATTTGIINEQVQLNAALANGTYLLSLRSGDEHAVYHFTVNR